MKEIMQGVLLGVLIIIVGLLGTFAIVAMAQYSNGICSTEPSLTALRLHL